ncbi:hypothetical protein [uncultured Adlercreutzia sp.]|uniref:hypothetical protein n=1 Tax=uncultured Adlercreutzia sp. TaxID=875803 RepID=UPI0025F861C7|nr:hypothetical protein [uncultured Adlercreutzia sp.]
METEQRSSASWYLRMFSYLLLLCGLFGVAVGAVVVAIAFADGAPTEASVSLSALVLGLSAIAANGVTLACGIVGWIASREPAQRGLLRTLGLVGIVASVMALGLCYATGAGLPTSLIFNLLLMVIVFVIANNLVKSAL